MCILYYIFENIINFINNYILIYDISIFSNNSIKEHVFLYESQYWSCSVSYFFPINIFIDKKKQKQMKICVNPCIVCSILK